MKLTIKKQTIANLESKEMENVKGGILLTITPSICGELCDPITELEEMR